MAATEARPWHHADPVLLALPLAISGLGLLMIYSSTRTRLAAQGLEYYGIDATEVERYIVMPGQACAYKVGMLKIQQLRQRAEQALGPKFNLKDFHNAVLSNGSLSLDILEEQIDAWIARSKAS